MPWCTPVTADLSALVRRHQIRISGQGQDAIVFVHGFGTDQRMWRLVAPAFEATHRVVLFDQAGCGGTDLADWEPGHRTLQAYADDLVRIVEGLSLREVTLVGHSIGGMIALMASVARPSLARRLVLMCSSPRFLDEPPDYVGGYQPAGLRAELPLVRVPALVLHIQGDRIVPASVAHYLHTHLAGSRLVMLEGQGHCAPLSHPRLTIAALREHLALK